MKATKITALMLSGLLLTTSVIGLTGCGKKKSKAEVISKDSPWFDTKTTAFESPDDSTNCYYNEIKYCDGYFYTSYTGYDDECYSDTTYFVKYSADGKVVQKEDPAKLLGIELKKAAPSGNSSCCGGVDEMVNISNIMVSKDKVKVVLDHYDYSSNDPEKWTDEKYLYDPNTGKAEKFTIYDSLLGKDDNGWIQSCSILNDGTYCFVVEIYSDTECSSEVKILITDDSKIIKTIDAKALGLDKEAQIYSAEIFGNTIVFSYFMSKGDYTDHTIQYDLETGETKELKTIWEACSYADDGNRYAINNHGIYKVDSDGKKSDTPNVSFDDCNILRSNIYNYSIYSANEEEGKYLLAGMIYSDNEKEPPHFESLEFTKADENPNAGKTVLSVGYLGYPSYATLKGIYEFNNSNDKYYAKLSNKYAESDDYDYSKYKDMTSEEIDVALNKEAAEVANNLAIDLISGDAPDVLMGTDSLLQIKNDNYLEDLSSKFSSDFNEADYFVNVLNGGKSGDKLYSVPLTFTVVGIAAKEEEAGSGVGFTYAEYQAFVKKYLNGYDPMYYGSRMGVFENLWSASSHNFYDENGNIDIKNDDFRELLDYIKEYIPEDSRNEDSEGMIYDYGKFDSEESMSQVGEMAYYNNIYSHLYNCQRDLKATVKVYGYPSREQQGPMVQIEDSVSISSSAVNPDGAWDFVKFMLSSDMQSDKNLGSNPVNKEACRAASKEILDSENKYAKRAIKEDPQNARYYHVFDDDIIDDYIAILESADQYYTSDPSVLVVLEEEISAYLADQKGFDDVADIIQDKTKTIIDERK
ncbi:MAG: carbohydrate ABC transporter substrate-binding protein [Clostridiales bacterium]|nr:carbohydrate ABC transporter substrate-binding protein [Clostridiales bacterium]